MISQVLDEKLDQLWGFEQEIKDFNIFESHQKNFNKIYLEQIKNNSLNEKKFSGQIQKTQSIESDSGKERLKKVKKVGKINQKKSLKKKQKRLDDDQYRLKIQNIRRNLFSNMAHHCIGFLKKKFVSEPVIKKIIEIHKININLQEFYDVVATIKLKNYVRPQILLKLWKGNYLNQILKNKEEFGKVFRIATSYFLNKVCYHSIQLSKKIRYTVKEEHWEKKRELLKQLARCL